MEISLNLFIIADSVSAFSKKANYERSVSIGFATVRNFQTYKSASEQNISSAVQSAIFLIPSPSDKMSGEHTRPWNSIYFSNLTGLETPN